MEPSLVMLLTVDACEGIGMISVCNAVKDFTQDKHDVMIIIVIIITVVVVTTEQKHHLSVIHKGIILVSGFLLRPPLVAVQFSSFTLHRSI
jgi:hypothetical protein